MKLIHFMRFVSGENHGGESVAINPEAISSVSVYKDDEGKEGTKIVTFTEEVLVHKTYCDTCSRLLGASSWKGIDE